MEMKVVIITNLTACEIYEKPVQKGHSGRYEAECIISQYCNPGDKVHWNEVER